MARINEKRLNKLYRRITKSGTVIGVKRAEVLRVVGALYGCDFAKMSVSQINETLAKPFPAEARKKPAPKPEPKVTPPRSSDTFYASWEWKRVRYEALKIHGRRCQCCGWQPGDCDGYLVVDHIKPRRHFPELELELSNLQVLCNDCNIGKGSAYADDFRSLEVRHRATIQ